MCNQYKSRYFNSLPMGIESDLVVMILENLLQLAPNAVKGQIKDK
jgi:hypothetical protein